MTRPGWSPRHSISPSNACLTLILCAPLLALGVSPWVGLVGGNLRQVVPQRVYRSAQPSPDQLRAWIARYGLKTVVNLRGPTAPGAAEEQAVAESEGVNLVYVSLSAYAFVPPRQLTRLIDVLETSRQPILLHCRYGIDRAGTASAIAAWLIGGQPYRRARYQAYVPPGPWRHRGSRPHISDTLTLYEQYCRRRALDPDDPNRFRSWARDVYDPNCEPSEVGTPGNGSSTKGLSKLRADPWTASYRSRGLVERYGYRPECH